MLGVGKINYDETLKIDTPRINKKKNSAQQNSALVRRDKEIKTDHTNFCQLSLTHSYEFLNSFDIILF